MRIGRDFSLSFAFFPDGIFAITLKDENLFSVFHLGRNGRVVLGQPGVRSGSKGLLRSRPGEPALDSGAAAVEA